MLRIRHFIAAFLVFIAPLALADNASPLFYSVPKSTASEALIDPSCAKKPIDPALIAAATEKATQIQTYLKEMKPEVALLARVGSDVSKYNMHYTHFGFVFKNPSNNKWSVVHLLNKCGTNTSWIYEQGLGTFLLDNLFKLDVKIIVPTADVQKKILAILKSDKLTSFHNKNYSMIAYPFSTQYQQSNQWILELLTSALFGTKDRITAQEYLRKTSYTPTLIPISQFSKFSAHFFRKNVSFNDHPDSEISSGKYSVVTVDSIVNYLKKQNLITAEKEF